MGQQLRIIVNRRQEIDLEKLATALLDYVETLSDEEVARLAALGDPKPHAKKKEDK